MQHSKFPNFRGGKTNLILWTNMVKMTNLNDLLTFFTQGPGHV